MVVFKPIGIIHSPFEDREGMPIQPAGAEGVRGTIVVEQEYQEGLKDLDGFSHIVLLYHFHKSEGYELSVKPFMDTVKRGLFSTRAPRRPNAIGQSIVKLLSVEENVVHIEYVDVLDGTPLLDIKPYVTNFIPPGPMRCGWMEEARKTVERRRSDDRFK